MGLNVKSLYRNNPDKANTSTQKSGLNVKSLRDQKFELKISADKSLGNISYGAKQAIESNTLDSYSPKNDAEKKVLDAFAVHVNAAAKQERIESNSVFKKYNIDPAEFGEEDLHKWATEHNFHYVMSDGGSSYEPNREGGKNWSVFGFGPKKLTTEQEEEELKVLEKLVRENRIDEMEEKSPAFRHISRAIQAVPYTIEKAGAGALGALENISDYALAGLSKLGSVVTTGKTSKGLDDYAGTVLAKKDYSTMWSESADKRYRVHDIVRDLSGTVEAAGNMAPAMATEYFTAGISPLGDMAIANYVAQNGAKAFVKAASKAIKPSDVVFGLSAAGSAASAGYEKSGKTGASLAYGAASGLAEVVTEKIFGGFAGTDIGDSLIDFTVKNPYIRKTLNLATEPLEEVLMSAADPLLQRATVDKNAAFASFKEYGESAKQGFLLSVLMGVATYPLKRNAVRKTVDMLNSASDGLNAIIIDENKKLEPLTYKATEEDMKYRQNEIKALSQEYAEFVENEVSTFAKKYEQAVAPSTEENPDKAVAKKDTEERAKNVVSPRFVKAVETVETDEAVQETAAETEIDENPTFVSVGDTFRDTKTGNTITVVERNAENTTVEIDTGSTAETREFTNSQADTLATNEQFEQMESSEALSPEDAQKYNIVVSNLKRKAEELGLLDNNFFTALQNVNLYNPTTSDRAVISSEFRRVFAGNTDPLITSWLDAIGVDAQPVTKNIAENKALQNTETSDIIQEKARRDGVKKNATVGEHDSIGETQLREDEKTRVYRRGNQGHLADYQGNPQRNKRESLSSDSREYGGGKTNSRETREVVRDVFHGTLYRFSEFLKSYVDLAIHFGTKEQAHARLNNKKGFIIKADLILRNPLTTEDIFGERTPEQYLESLVEKSLLSVAEKKTLQERFAEFLETDLKTTAFESLEEKLLRGKYQIQTTVDSDGVYVTLALIDADSNINEIPMAEIIDRGSLLEILGLDLTAQVLRDGALSAEAKEALASYLLESVLPFEMQYLKLRKIEDILKSFGYDGFIYRNQNEGGGFSYAVFDNSQIVRNDDTKPTKSKSGVKSSRDNITALPESVTEPTENVIKKADSVMETPDTEKITVDMDDEKRAELLNKKSVNVVSVDAENTKALDNIDLDALQNSYPSYARPIVKKIARDFGILNEPFFNPDIELEFSYSGESIQESINKQHSRYGDLVKMLSVFPDVIKNAVGIETHKDKYTGTRREDTNLKQMYVLASAFSDEKGVYPVKLEVKEFKKNTNKLYLSVVLTKKESRYLSGNLGQNQLNTAPPTSTISISDLVGIVNPSEGDFLKYFPDSMLDSEQIEGKNKALAKDTEKVERLTADKKRSLATAENANAFSFTPETTSSTASTDIVSQDDDTVNSSVRTDVENDTKPTKSKSGVKSSRDTATESSRADRWSADRVAENTESKSTVSISEIIEQISSEFGIPISTGKVTDRDASGIYKEKPETIRTRVSNNLPTISHELGHHLDKKYNLNELGSVEEIRGIVSEEFLDQYPDDAINGELVAEFVRRYLKNSNDANRLCPEFYNDFVRTLSKEDLATVNRVAKQINEYLSYDIDKRYESSVISAKKAKKMQKLLFAEKWKNLYTGWVDKFHPLKQITDYVSEVKGSVLSGAKNAYVLATNSLNAHTIANYQVLEGFRDLNGNFVDGAKSLIECIGMVNSKDINTFDLYLKLKHALEVIGKGKRVFADEVLEDTDNIKKKIAEIEKEHPEMIDAANNLYEFQYNMLKHFAVPSGIMTMEQVEYLHHEYPCYVPFYRFIKNKKGGMFAKSSFVNQSSPIMRQTGSGLDTLSHLESIIRNVEKIIKASVRNQTAAVLGSYADSVDGIGQFIESVSPDMLPHTIDITALKENFANRLQEVVKSGDDFFAISGLMDEVFGDDVTDFTPIANESKKIISVMRGGERSYYQIHDDALFSAVAELSPQQADGWIKFSNTIMQPMKLLITQNNPIFAVTNAMRDFGTAYKLSEINNIVTFTTQYAKALGGIIANSEDYKKYKAMGGGHSSELSANIENISKTLRRVAQKDMGKARRLAYSIFRHPVDTVASINDAIESIPRFMEFERTLKENGDLQKAIFNASDITTNFKRSGSSNTAKFVNSSIMFNNAAIQGLDKTFRTLTAKNPKKRYGTLLKWLLHALIMGILGYLYNKEVDEEGYKNLSSYKKNNFYNFAIGDGKFISLPKPRENALLDTVTERTIEYLFGDNEEAFYDFSSYLGSQLLPPMLPDTLHPVDAVHSVGGSTIFGGLLDVGFNKDFKGTPIEGDYDKYTPSNERYTESTTKLAYELGQTKLARDWDMSPKKIDHLISSYTGILGQVNTALFPMNENLKDTSFGLRNKFVSDSNYSTDVLNRMYENKKKAEKVFNYSGSVGDAVEYEKNSVITSYISGMKKAVKALPEEEQRNGRAYLLKTLNSWNYEDTASQSNMLSSLADSTVSKDCIFSELPSSTLEWTVNKQKYVYQMIPQEYYKYISDYLTVVENARRHYGDETVESYEAAKEAAKEYMSKYKKSVLKNQYLSKATKAE